MNDVDSVDIAVAPDSNHQERLIGPRGRQHALLATQARKLNLEPAELPGSGAARSAEMPLPTAEAAHTTSDPQDQEDSAASMTAVQVDAQHASTSREKGDQVCSEEVPPIYDPLRSSLAASAGCAVRPSVTTASSLQPAAMAQATRLYPGLGPGSGPGPEAVISWTRADSDPARLREGRPPRLDVLPNEILIHILTLLDVGDVLTTSRINHHFRKLSLDPVLHAFRLSRAKAILPPLLFSPFRPSLAELISKAIFQTNTTRVSRRLARNLAAIRLSRRLPRRPSAESLVQRGVLPGECLETGLAPSLVGRKRAVEKERLKDRLRRFLGEGWRDEVYKRSEGVRRWEENAGVGRVWRLRRFWERLGCQDEA